jgi:SAM-dependent methyltransferase
VTVPTLPDQHLDLGCGSVPRNPYGRARLCGCDLRPMPGFEGHEFRAANLSLDPIPWPDHQFTSVSAFDFFEHVPRVLASPDGRSTWFPFIRLMNEVWRVLAPGGRLYALTPAYPRPEAFGDPTHVNIITEQTHTYFCGADTLGRMYGFDGEFRVLRAEWARLPEAFSATPKVLTFAEAWKYRKRVRQRRLSHFLWELEAVKPAGAASTDGH